MKRSPGWINGAGGLVALWLGAGALGCLSSRPVTAPPMAATGQPLPRDLAAPAIIDQPGSPGANAPAPVVAARERVQRVGAQILRENPSLGVKPVWVVLNDEQPVLLRQEHQQVLVSVGLINRCATDGQLAAVLATQVGAMYSEKKAAIEQASRGSHREPPPNVSFTRQNGNFGDSDQYYKAEIATLGLDRRRTVQVQPLDPLLVARQVLVQAGYSELDLDAMVPLLQAIQPAQ